MGFESMGVPRGSPDKDMIGPSQLGLLHLEDQSSFIGPFFLALCLGTRGYRDRQLIYGPCLVSLAAS
jgi:hypothetical protein